MKLADIVIGKVYFVEAHGQQARVRAIAGPMKAPSGRQAISVEVLSGTIPRSARQIGGNGELLAEGRYFQPIVTSENAADVAHWRRNRDDRWHCPDVPVDALHAMLDAAGPDDTPITVADIRALLEHMHAAQSRLEGLVEECAELQTAADDRSVLAEEAREWRRRYNELARANSTMVDDIDIAKGLRAVAERASLTDLRWSLFDLGELIAEKVDSGFGADVRALASAMPETGDSGPSTSPQRHPFALIDVIDAAGRRIQLLRDPFDEGIRAALDLPQFGRVVLIDGERAKTDAEAEQVLRNALGLPEPDGAFTAAMRRMAARLRGPAPNQDHLQDHIV